MIKIIGAADVALHGNDPDQERGVNQDLLGLPLAATFDEVRFFQTGCSRNKRDLDDYSLELNSHDSCPLDWQRHRPRDLGD